MSQAPDPLASRRRPVFISFASEDLDLANQLLARLESAAIRCWIAHRDIGPAESYPAAISAAVASSGALLLLLTEHANRSPHVLREVEMAFNARTPILPVRMSGIVPSPELQYFLSTSQWLDAGATFDADEAARLQVVLEQLLDRKTLEDDAWEQRRRRRKRTAIAVAGGAVTLAIVLFLGAIWRSARSDDAAGGGKAAAVNPRDGATYVWVPPGEFLMGCSTGDSDCEDDERPVHSVAIRQGFWLARTEATAAQYNRRPSGPPVEALDADLPAAGVTWAEARDYCASIGGRLPTEAEWEYAARAGTTTRFYAAPADVAWYETNSDGRPHPVGTKAPNAFGLHDMLGNVAEWVRDRYYNAYDDSGEETGIAEPQGPNVLAVARGGSWVSETLGLRVSRRIEMWPDTADPIFGFRCAHDRL